MRTIFARLTLVPLLTTGLTLTPVASADSSDVRVDFCVVDGATGQRVTQVPVELEALMANGNWRVQQSGGDSSPTGCTSWFNQPANLTYRVATSFNSTRGCLAQGTSASGTAGPGGVVELGDVPASCGGSPAGSQPLPMGASNPTPQGAAELTESEEGGDPTTGAVDAIGNLNAIEQYVHGKPSPCFMYLTDVQIERDMESGKLRVSPQTLAKHQAVTAQEARQLFGVSGGAC